MRTLLVIVILIALMVAGGWLAFTYRGGSALVEFNANKAKKDIDQAVDETQSFVRDVNSSRDTTTTIENREIVAEEPLRKQP